jgi:hypothetical protein
MTVMADLVSAGVTAGDRVDNSKRPRRRSASEWHASTGYKHSATGAVVRGCFGDDQTRWARGFPHGYPPGFELERMSMSAVPRLRQRESSICVRRSLVPLKLALAQVRLLALRV